MELQKIINFTLNNNKRNLPSNLEIVKVYASHHSEPVRFGAGIPPKIIRVFTDFHTLRKETIHKPYFGLLEANLE